MQIKAPDLGVESAEVSEILVKVGDTVQQEQSLLVLESAKASVEVPSPVSGVIGRVLVSPGQAISQGEVLFEMQEAAAGNTLKQANQQQSDNKQTASDTQQSGVSQSSTQNLSPAGGNSNAVQQAAALAQSGQASKSQNVIVPDLGVEDAEVSEILVRVGDTVQQEQSLLVLESAKASVEVPSPYAGVVQSIAVQAGQKVTQGMAILAIAATASDLAPQPSLDAAPSAPAGGDAGHPLRSQAAPQLADSAPAMQKAPEQSSASQESAAPPARQDGAAASTARQLSAEQLTANASVYAGPAVRQLARQLGVALAAVTPSGNQQRIIKQDVFAFVKQQLLGNNPPASKAPSAAATGLPPLPDFEKFGGSTRVAMSRLQQVSVPQLSLNQFIPQVTQFDLADITELEHWRNNLKADYKKQDISLTILAFIVKAVAHLLKTETLFNSHLADDQKSIMLRKEIHMGIAVATPDGLTVPVLRHPDQLSIRDIAIQLGALGQKARDKKLKPQELQGAGFTITSLGSLGGTAFTPLVNWPQVAILGISPASMQAVWDGSSFQPRLMLPLSLSYDHRVINGADAARFSKALTSILADIRRVLL